MEHLLNCHGEWVAFAALLPSLPILGPWIRYKLFGTIEHDHDHPRLPEGDEDYEEFFHGTGI